jgi:hypothetical protein
MGGSTGDLLGTGNTGGGSFAQPMTGADYNRRLQAGESSQAIRDSQRGGLFGGGGLSDNQFNDIVTQAGMQSPTGRPLAGSAQFYQPVFQPQYQNYNMGNPMSISQYGQQQFGGFGGGFGGGFMPQQQFMPQMQSPFQQFQPQQPTMFGGQMQGGGYGQFGMNNPFSPYSNSFLNIDQNINQRPVQQQVGAYRNAIQSGFNDQQIMNQVTGLFGQQNPTDMNFLRNQAFPAQQPMPQAQSPFRSSGPSQAIVGRSSQMRGTPNVMRRAEGGITSLMGKA